MGSQGARPMGPWDPSGRTHGNLGGFHGIPGWALGVLGPWGPLALGDRGPWGPIDPWGSGLLGPGPLGPHI